MNGPLEALCVPEPGVYHVAVPPALSVSEPHIRFDTRAPTPVVVVIDGVRTGGRLLVHTSGVGVDTLAAFPSTPQAAEFTVEAEGSVGHMHTN